MNFMCVFNVIVRCWRRIAGFVQRQQGVRYWSLDNTAPQAPDNVRIVEQMLLGNCATKPVLRVTCKQ